MSRWDGGAIKGVMVALLPAAALWFLIIRFIMWLVRKVVGG